MTTSTDGREHSLNMAVADWLRIDSVLDSEIQDLRDKMWESETPDQVDLPTSKLAELAEEIRQAGWHQIPDWPKDAHGLKSWPTPGQTATLTLTAQQWGLVVSALQRWAVVDEEAEPENSAACVHIAAMIRQQFSNNQFGEVPPVRTTW